MKKWRFPYETDFDDTPLFDNGIGHGGLSPF